MPPSHALPFSRCEAVRPRVVSPERLTFWHARVPLSYVPIPCGGGFAIVRWPPLWRPALRRRTRGTSSDRWSAPAQRFREGMRRLRFAGGVREADVLRRTRHAIAITMSCLVSLVTATRPALAELGTAPFIAKYKGPPVPNPTSVPPPSKDPASSPPASTSLAQPARPTGQNSRFPLMDPWGFERMGKGTSILLASPAMR
jgi:hypothetical protein